MDVAEDDNPRCRKKPRRSRRVRRHTALRRYTHSPNLFNSPALVKRLHATVLHADPPVFSLDGVLSPDAAAACVDACAALQWTASSVESDSNNKRHKSSNRTSSTCFLPSVTHQVAVRCGAERVLTKHLRVALKRVADALGLTLLDAEVVQLTRYRKGQQYRVHHDCVAVDWDGTGGNADTAVTLVNQEDQTRATCFRVYTAFLYLTSNSAACGTHFPLLDDLVVQPVVGRVAIWRNVTKNGRIDKRVVHAGLPAPDGETKLGVNLWFGHAS